MSLQQGASQHEDSELLPTAEYATGDPAESPRHTSAKKRRSSRPQIPSPSISRSGSGLRCLTVRQRSIISTGEILNQDASRHSSLPSVSWKQKHGRSVKRPLSGQLRKDFNVSLKQKEAIQKKGRKKRAETHVINITGFSAYGKVKDGDSPPDPVRALVLLFYRPPADPDADLTSFLNVLLVPGNVDHQDVLRVRKKIYGDEMFIEASPHCKLKPKKVYRLITSPQGRSVTIQPRKVRFHEESQSNYLTSFQVILETMTPHIKLRLRDTNSSFVVWKGEVDLPSVKEIKSCKQLSLNLTPNNMLIPPTENKLTRSISLPDILYKEFIPDITPDFDDETYRFQCSSPGLYLCSVTGVMFDMKGEGDVVYRIVSWNRRLLVQHHKKPAGPLFDIKCVQQCVSQLHLPHCEIRSTGGGQFLSVAHVTDGDVEFIRPQKITETHVVINITGFSAYGNVKDGDSPPDPVRALVLLFYRPPKNNIERSVLNVLIVPRNVVLRDVQRTRRKLNGEETFIDTAAHCKLKPDQLYTLSTSPQNDFIKVQPAESEFDGESHSSYVTSFQVILKKVITDIELFLRDTNSSLVVWKSEVYLPSAKERSSQQCSPSLPPDERLLSVRCSFIEKISEANLKSLLDKLLEKRVISDPERESVNVEKTRGDKARVVIDTVRKKGEDASRNMIECFCEVDSFLCEHLALI